MLRRFINQSAVKSKQNATTTLRRLAPVTCVSSEDWLILEQEELQFRWPHQNDISSVENSRHGKRAPMDFFDELIIWK